MPLGSRTVRVAWGSFEGSTASGGRDVGGTTKRFEVACVFVGVRRARVASADDLRQRLRAVVDPLFGEVPKRLNKNGALPRLMLERDRERARERLVEALAWSGSGEISAAQRGRLEDLVRKWSERDFEPGFAEAREFEIACAEEHDKLEAERSGDPVKVFAVREQAHRRAIVEAYGSIEIRGLQMSARVHQDLDIAFVPLHIEDPSQARSVKLKEGLALRQIPRLEATEVVRLHDRVLIVGAPGSGKTTLVAYLAARAAAGKLFNEHRLEGDWVPFVVPVRSLGGARLSEESIARAAGCELAFVRDVLAQKRALVLVDGLDEAGAERLVDLLPSIRGFAKEHPGNKIALTTRPGSEPDDPRTRVGGFATTRLLPLTRDEVYLFIDRWCLAAELSIQKERKKAREDAERAASDLKGRVQTSRAVERLAETPLMASVLCIVHRFLGQRVPERRAALYEACTNVLLYEWDRAKFPEGSFIGQLDAQMKRVLLGGVARSMHESGLAELARDKVIEQFAKRLPLVGHGADEAAAIVTEIQDRSGLLVERSPGVFAFSHLTFQEYLTAVEYVREGAYELLASRHADAWWHEVIALAAGLPSADAGRIVRVLLKMDTKEVSTATMVAAQCLETAIEIPASLREAVEARVAKLIPPRNDEDMWRVIEFGSISGPVLLRALPKGNADERARVAVALGQLQYEPAGRALAKLMSDSTATTELIGYYAADIKVFPGIYQVALYAASALANIAQFSESCRVILETAIPNAADVATELFSLDIYKDLMIKNQPQEVADYFNKICLQARDIRLLRGLSRVSPQEKRSSKRGARSG